MGCGSGLNWGSALSREWAGNGSIPGAPIQSGYPVTGWCWRWPPSGYWPMVPEPKMPPIWDCRLDECLDHRNIPLGRNDVASAFPPGPQLADPPIAQGQALAAPLVGTRALACHTGPTENYLPCTYLKSKIHTPVNPQGERMPMPKVEGHLEPGSQGTH